MAIQVLGVLAGATKSYQSLLELALSADKVFAADSGQEICRANGFFPDVVVGDLDSVIEKYEEVEYRQINDQDCSDIDKMLAEVSQLGDVQLILAGLEGDRFDHMLSSLASIVRSKMECKILLQQGYAQLVRAGNLLTHRNSVGTTFSIIGLTPSLVSTYGSHWDINKGELSFSQGVSLSNVIKDDPFKLVVYEGVCLVIFSECEAKW